MDPAPGGQAPGQRRHGTVPTGPQPFREQGAPQVGPPLLHRTPVHCSLSGPSSRGTCSQLGTPATCRCRCPVLGAPPSCGRSAGPADSGDEDPSADVTWAPAVPGPGPCATPRSGRSAGSRTGCLTWGLPSQVGPGRALQVQVQPPPEAGTPPQASGGSAGGSGPTSPRSASQT